MGGMIGVKFGKTRRKQSAAASTTSEKVFICQGLEVGINRCEIAIESIYSIDCQHSTKFKCV